MGDTGPLHNIEEVENNGAQIISALMRASDLGTNTTDFDSMEVITNILAFGYVYATSRCESAYVAGQDISISCDDALGPLVRANPNCTACIKGVGDALKNRYDLDAIAKNANPLFQSKPLSYDLLQKMEGFDVEKYAQGACRYVCYQCVVEDVNQTLSIRATTGCDQNTPEYRSAFAAGLSHQAKIELKEQIETLREAGIELRNEEDVVELGVQLGNAIFQMSTQESLEELQNNAIAVQRLEILPGSTSVTIKSSDQVIDIESVSSIVSQTYSEARIKAAIDHQSNLDIINERVKFSALVSEITQSINTIQDLLQSIIGKVMISLAAILCAIVLAFIAYLFLAANSDDMFTV